MKTFYCDEAIHIAFWHNVVLVQIWGDVTVSRMQQLGRAYRALLEHHPAGVCSLSVLEVSTPVAAAEARQESTRMINDLGASILHMTVVIEAQGVGGLMMRSIARGLNVLMKRRRMSLHDDMGKAIEQTLRFASASTGSSTPESTADLRRALRSLRAGRPALSS